MNGGEQEHEDARQVDSLASAKRSFMLIAKVSDRRACGADRGAALSYLISATGINREIFHHVAIL